MLYKELKEIALQHGFTKYNPKMRHTASPAALSFKINAVEILIDYEWDEDEEPTKNAFLSITHDDTVLLNSTVTKTAENVLIYIVTNPTTICNFIEKVESSNDEDIVNLILNFKVNG